MNLLAGCGCIAGAIGLDCTGMVSVLLFAAIAPVPCKFVLLRLSRETEAGANDSCNQNEYRKVALAERPLMERAT